MYRVTITDRAVEDIAFFRKAERQLILRAAESILASQPATPTRNRKALRANPLAEWELRVGDL